MSGISTEQAMKMVDEKLSAQAKNAQPDPAPEQEEEKKEPVETSTPDPKPEDEPEKEEPEKDEPEKDEPEQKGEDPEKGNDDGPEEKAKPSKKTPPSKKYSHEERVNHAFSLEKQKRAKLREKLKAQEARNKKLEAELEKYKGLKLEDFKGNVDDYTDWKLKERDMQNEVQRNKESMEQLEKEEVEAENERRINLSFESEEERAEYRELLRTKGAQFYEALEEADKNNVVLTYLNGVEEYPKVLKELMTNMDALRHVFRDKDPVELRHNLHVFTKEFLSGKNPVENQQKTNPSDGKPAENKPAAKPAIPVIGKQVTANAKATEPVHDRAYWNNYLRQHPRG